MHKMESMKVLKENYKKIIIIVTISLIYLVLMFFLARLIGIDSDKANHLLQAKDILEGNIFMSDWNLTGVTFFTTDLLFYELGYLFCGVSLNAIYFAAGLMMGIPLIVACYMCTIDKGHKMQKMVALAMLIMIPGINMVKVFRVHNGAIICSLLYIILCYFFIKRDESKGKSLIIAAIFLFLGSAGDMLTLLEAYIPVCVLCLFILLYSKRDILVRKARYVIIFSTLSVALSVVFNKLYFVIGRANKNGYIHAKCFDEIDSWGEKFGAFLRDLTLITNADYMGARFKDILSLIKIVNYFIILVVLVIVIRSLILLILGKLEKLDYLSAVLSIGIVCLFLVYLHTELAASHYITFIPIAGAIILVRNLGDFFEHVNNKRLFSVIVISILLLSFFTRVYSIVRPVDNFDENEYIGLAKFLNENGLKNGYGSFWDASLITVISKDEVEIRHIECDDGQYQKYSWFCKNEWYEDEKQFVLIDNSNEDLGDSDDFYVSAKNTIANYGEPTKTYYYGNYYIMVYDQLPRY